MRLDDAARMLRARFPSVARLDASDAHRLFGGPPAAGTLAAPAPTPPVAQAAAPLAAASSAEGGGAGGGAVNWPRVLERSYALHGAIEAGDGGAAEAALRGNGGGNGNDDGNGDARDRALVANQPCPRTGLPPLHKALEGGLGPSGGPSGGGSAATPSGGLVRLLAALLAAGADPAQKVRVKYAVCVCVYVCGCEGVWWVSVWGGVGVGGAEIRVTAALASAVPERADTKPPFCSVP